MDIRENTKYLLERLPEKARKLEADHKKYMARLRDRNPHKLDETFERLHEEAFADIDCMACANCCRVLGPKFLERDVDRAAKLLGMHPKTFKSQYLVLDEDKDLVLRKLPCPFLQDDNSCFIYDARPKACAEYPHTNLKNMRGRIGALKKDISVCPAVFEIVEKLRKAVPL